MKDGTRAYQNIFSQWHEWRHIVSIVLLNHSNLPSYPLPIKAPQPGNFFILKPVENSSIVSFGYLTGNRIIRRTRLDLLADFYAFILIKNPLLRKRTIQTFNK